MTNITIGTAIKEYQKTLNTTAKSSFLSAFLKYGYQCLGECCIKSKRLTKTQINKAFKKLDKKDIKELTELLERVEKTEEFTALNANSKKQNRFHIGKFIDWIKAQYFGEITKLESQQIELEQIKLFGQDRQGTVKKIKTTRKQQKRLALSLDEVPPEVFARINNELEKFKIYQMKSLDCREVSADRTIISIKTLLGWWYRNKAYNNKNEISLNSLIPFVKLKFSFGECGEYTTYLVKEGTAKHECKEQAKKLINTLENEFFPGLDNKISQRTKELYYASLISLAKYIYCLETDLEYGDNFEDIPLIQYLRVQRKKQNKNANTREEKPLITWEKVMSTLEICRQEALVTKHSYTRGNGLSTRKRRPRAIAVSYQRFLILSFFTLLPPDRQRTIRELKVGKTLKYGEFVNNRFIEADPTKDSTKKWYIYLKPEDYKTGDTYGEWRGEVPNVEFKDGTKFYEYIFNWLYGKIRDALNITDKSYMFSVPTTGKQYYSGSMVGLLKAIFVRITGVPITPHQLRHIYVTHLRDLGVTDAEKEAAAYWMKHSRETADKIYSHQTIENKVAPVYGLMEKVNKLS